MNEVEKMYENCNIKPKQKGYCDWDSSCPYTGVGSINCDYTCPYWKYEDEAKYPPFTAEKQVEILQFCLKWGQVHILSGIGDEYRIENSCYRQGYQPTIAAALANYINEKWKKLTPEERKQIKEILE